MVFEKEIPIYDRNNPLMYYIFDIDPYLPRNIGALLKVGSVMFLLI